MKRVLITLMFLLLCGPVLAGYCQEDRAIAPLVFNAVSVDNSDPAFYRIRFSLEAIPGNNPVNPVQQKAAVSKAVEFFFLGLSLPEERLWVNLNPDEPEKVIALDLKDTDLGKVIMAADLQLKKDVAAATNPQISPAGREYWDKLYSKAEELGIEDKIAVSNRVWIIPDLAWVHETPGAVELVESPLKVLQESEYLPSDARGVDPKQRELSGYADRLFGELILPVLTRKVNEESPYARLRGVYRALLLAHWYKKSVSGRGDRLMQNSAATALQDAASDLSVFPEQIYKEYMKSFRKGEYNFSENTKNKLDFYLNVISRAYFSGGVNLDHMETREAGGNADRQSSGKEIVSVEFNIPRDCPRPLEYVKKRLFAGSFGSTEPNNKELVNNLPGVVPGKPYFPAQEKAFIGSL